MAGGPIRRRDGTNAGRVGPAARVGGRLLEPRGSPQRADHAGRDGDPGGAGARTAVTVARRAGGARARRTVNPYAVKYGLGRAWGYTVLSFWAWPFYWFWVNR